MLDALWQRELLGAGRRGQLRDASRDVAVGVMAQAARAAAVTVGRPGADPPYRRELL
jgi:fructokinase